MNRDARPDPPGAYVLLPRTGSGGPATRDHRLRCCSRAKAAVRRREYA